MVSSCKQLLEKNKIVRLYNVHLTSTFATKKKCVNRTKLFVHLKMIHGKPFTKLDDYDDKDHFPHNK
jgi:hypothetical protein